MYDTFQRNHLEGDEQNKNIIMRNVFHNKGCKLGMTQEHLEPLPIPLIKGTYDGKPDKFSDDT